MAGQFNKIRNSHFVPAPARRYRLKHRTTPHGGETTEKAFPSSPKRMIPKVPPVSPGKTGRLLKLSLSYLISGTAASLSCLPARAADNVIANGGFEDGMGSWWGPAANSEAIRTEMPAEGLNALQLTGGFVCQDKRPVEGGKNYKISVKMRCAEAPEGSAYVQLSYRGGSLNPKWYGEELVEVGGNKERALFVADSSPEWKEYSAVVETPAEATEILLYLRKDAASGGEVFFDDIRVTPED
jgi:hypothetical protein